MSPAAGFFVFAVTVGLIGAPVVAYDCGDSCQPGCSGPVPTTDQVVAIMAELTDIEPAPNNLAGATVTTSGDSSRQNSYGIPIVLVDQGGHWLITHDSGMAELDVFWRVATAM